jgi:hypothetical protein
MKHLLPWNMYRNTELTLCLGVLARNVDAEIRRTSLSIRHGGREFSVGLSPAICPSNQVSTRWCEHVNVGLRHLSAVYSNPGAGNWRYDLKGKTAFLLTYV